MPEPPTKNYLTTQQQRTDWMLKLTKVVRQTGEHILRINPQDIYDTIPAASHPFSTADGAGSNKLRSVVAEIFGADFNGTILEESETVRVKDNPAYPLIIGDAIEGSTNAKRGLAAFIKRPILAGTSVFILEGDSLCTIAASAFFDFDSQQVFSSVRGEAGSFLPFMNNTLLDSSEVKKTKGDSNTYVIVPSYSHQNIQARGQIILALQKAGMIPMDGSRSSAQDLLNILANQFDAYVDLRALLPCGDDNNEHLRSWDIGGILPVLNGSGFCVTDERNQGWQLNSFRNPLSLIVTRPEIHKKILDAISDLPFINTETAEKGQSVKFPQVIPNIS